MKYTLDKKDDMIEYIVTENSSVEPPCYGIKVIRNNVTFEQMDNLFFTKEEADSRCRWLVENEVFPEIFRDIMADIML